jgi:peptide/nickel transport system substrate-binding protein
MLSYLKFRFSRQIRRFRRESALLRKWSANYLNRHIWGKWRQLGIIRWLVVAWWGIILVALVGLINQTSQLKASAMVRQPVPGGRYVEGVVGKVRIINPILPDTAASNDVSRLIFSGLTRYNAQRQLEPDLATSWTVSPDGKTYTFKLRDGVTWQDGVPFTSQDVAFTLTAIQNPDSRSPLATSWQGVQVNIIDDHTVAFVLPNAYPPFLTATTVGILPRHLLETVEPSNLRTNDFNQHPVGTGPFKINNFTSGQREVNLLANDRYYAGKPLLDEFAFETYDQPNQVVEAYAKHQVNAIGRVNPAQMASASHLKDLKLYEMVLPEETNVFFKTSAGLLADKTLRAALVQGIDRSAIINSTLGGLAAPVTGPLLPGQPGYSAKFRQPGYDAKAAAAALDAAGWVRGTDGYRAKEGQRLKFRLVTLDGGSYPQVAENLRQQWKQLGAEIEVNTVDLTMLQQSYIRPRNYDMLLFGINIGPDPDVYSYWHSSQATDPGENLSQYNSPAADKALESGRINSDSDVRMGKYYAFQKAWTADNPALALYNPYYYYATTVDAAGISAKLLADPTNRFYRVERWTIHSTMVPRKQNY